MEKADLDILCDAMDRWMRRTVVPRRDALDAHPAAAGPFDPAAALAETGVLMLAGSADGRPDGEAILCVLERMAQHCAGFGAVAALCLAAEIAKGMLAAAAAPPGIAPLCLWEEEDAGLDGGMPAFGTVVRNGRVSGVKKSVLLAPYGGSFLVLAGRGGDYRLALVDAQRAGVELSEDVNLMGIRIVRCADVAFEQAETVAEAPLTWAQLVEIMAVTGLFGAACACGTASQALAEAHAYAASRYQGGKMIGDHDAIRLLHGEGDAALAAGWAALREACLSLDAGSSEATMRCLAAKAAATRAAVDATLHAVQILGGYGYMRDCGMEKRLRDAATLAVVPFDNTRTILLAEAIRRGAETEDECCGTAGARRHGTPEPLLHAGAQGAADEESCTTVRSTGFP